MIHSAAQVTIKIFESGKDISHTSQLISNDSSGLCCLRSQMNYLAAPQVTTTVLKSGEEIESDIVVVGVGARPNVELLKGQVDLLEDKPGGVKVCRCMHA